MVAKQFWNDRKHRVIRDEYDASVNYSMFLHSLYPIIFFNASFTI